MPLPDFLYRPIDCGFYDRIEAAAVRGRPCTLVLLGPDGAQTIQARIADVFSRDQAEFVRLADGTEARLDRVLSLDGVPRPGGGTGTCAA